MCEEYRRLANDRRQASQPEEVGAVYGWNYEGANGVVGVGYSRLARSGIVRCYGLTVKWKAVASKFGRLMSRCGKGK